MIADYDRDELGGTSGRDTIYMGRNVKDEIVEEKIVEKPKHKPWENQYTNIGRKK